MNIEDITVWAKTTVLGIVILGALGSLLALLALKILRWLWSKCIDGFMHSLTPLLRGGLVGKFVAQLVMAKHADKTVLHYLDMILGLVLSSLLLAVFSVATIVQFSIHGAHATKASILLLSLTFAAAYLWLRDAFFYVSARQVFLGDEVDEYSKTLRKKTSVDQLLKMDREQSQSPNQAVEGTGDPRTACQSPHR